MSIGILNLIGICAVLVAVSLVGIYSGKKVKNAADFMTGGGKSGSWIVCGSIMGALVSSQATVGTAQLAFNYGMAAWWFTLGSGIGCLLLALMYTSPLRNSGCTTVLQVIAREYGQKAEYIGSTLCSIGIFISVLAQVVACTGLITVIFPVSNAAGAIISIAIMTIYVVFGGAWGAGMGGVLKLVLLYAACITACIVLFAQTGISDLIESLRNVLVGTPLGETSGLESVSDVTARFGSLISRGAAKDIGSGVSLVLGVLSTQTYAQAVLAGRSNAVAKKGALFAACLIPPIGIAGILIGLFMRTQYITQAEVDLLISAGESIPEGMGIIASTVQVFPIFVVNHMPVLVAGVVIGVLLLSIVGGGAGLSLGVATIVVNDILKHISKRFSDVYVALRATRVTIVVVLIIAAAIACILPAATINDLGFLSMGMRGAVVFVPLTCALFLSGRVEPKFALASIIVGPIAVLCGKLVGVSYDPLFLGVLICCLLCIMGGIYSSKKKKGINNP